MVQEAYRAMLQVERAAGLQFFEKVENRHALEPLCDGNRMKCGVGPVDGRVQGWKMLGHLKLSQDCTELKQTWEEIQSSQGKSDTMPLMIRTRDSLAGRMACEWKAAPSPPNPGGG